MKNKLLVLMGILCVSLSACGDKETTQSSAVSDTVEEQTKDSTTAQVPDTADNESIDATQTAPQTTDVSGDETVDNTTTYSDTESPSTDLNTPDGQTYTANVTFNDYSHDEYNDAGYTILSVTAKFPTVTIDGNDAAAQAINSYYETTKAGFDTANDELIAAATQEFAQMEDSENWSYGSGKDYTVEYNDGHVLSIVEESYQFTGGAHPETVHSAQNFDLATGKQLTLLDILSDADSGKEFIHNYILELSKGSEYSGMFFDGYEDSISSIIQDGSWYYSDNGIIFMADPYIMGPYASGLIKFTIPYSAFEGH